jgi:hypothetical protein
LTDSKRIDIEPLAAINDALLNITGHWIAIEVGKKDLFESRLNCSSVGKYQEKEEKKTNINTGLNRGLGRADSNSGSCILASRDLGTFATEP